MILYRLLLPALYFQSAVGLRFVFQRRGEANLYAVGRSASYVGQTGSFNMLSERKEKKDAVFIIGSTGSGKTKLGIDLCCHLAEAGVEAEIINADSMQVYKNFDIGTAKPTPSELASVPHHLLGVVDFDEVYNAARFVKQCEDIAGQLNSRGVLPVIVGGTQMYIQSILWRSAVDVDEGSDAKFEEVRARLIKLSPPEAYQRLLEVDPLRARQLHPNDHRRVIRSLEVN
eukprot:GHVN01020834.1.p3 GENE.GHVN01020834.1~~GHVN01020834.1.p3  ORF type:complete len:229 (+),score=38.74 GHVN01020834.1:137-823(+)